MKKALIAGSTGLVGGELVQMIIKDEYYDEIKVLSRRPIGLSDDRITEIIIDDFDQLPDYVSSLDADDIFCCLGTTIKKAGNKENFRKVDFTYPEKLAEITQAKKGSKFILVSAIGANKDSMFFYNRVKGEVEESIAGKNFETVIIFRPSLLLGNRRESRFGEEVAQKLSPVFSALLVGSLKKYKPISAGDVASGMLRAAKKNLKGVHIFDSYQIEKL